MERQAPYADHYSNPYTASQMQQIALQRMQQNAGMDNFRGRPDSYVEKEHTNMPSKAERQWQWDKNAPIASAPMSSHLYSEGQERNAARSFYEGQLPDPEVDIEKQTNKDSRLQTHEQDMEIGYEDKPSIITFEGLEQRFLEEIMKLAKEQSDAENAENVRHMEKIVEINTRYLEKVSSLRSQQATRREEFLVKEAQTRLHQYHQQAGLDQHPVNAGTVDPRGQHPINPGTIDPRGSASMEAHRAYPPGQLECQHPINAGTIDPRGSAAMEAHRAYPPGQLDSYRERTPLVGAGRNQATEARVPIPEGRVYNNSTRHY